MYQVGDRVLWTHKNGDSFTGVITSVSGDSYPYRVKPDDPLQARTMLCLEQELTPLVRTPEEVEVFLEGR